MNCRSHTREAGGKWPVCEQASRDVFCFAAAQSNCNEARMGKALMSEE